METSTIDHLFLELSQFSKAKTKREIELEQKIKSAGAMAVRLYHAHLVEHLINCGIVLFPAQISALQNILNAYVESIKEVDPQQEVSPSERR